MTLFLMILNQYHCLLIQKQSVRLHRKLPHFPGWISPVILASKHIIQKLWAQNIDWDDQAPQKLIDAWCKIKSEINYIYDLRIPRWINYTPNDNIELHGFSDASELGFAAALYIKNASQKAAHLLVAKARVTPKKEARNCDNVTIPRLELYAALL